MLNGPVLVVIATVSFPMSKKLYMSSLINAGTLGLVPCKHIKDLTLVDNENREWTEKILKELAKTITKLGLIEFDTVLDDKYDIF